MIDYDVENEDRPLISEVVYLGYETLSFIIILLQIKIVSTQVSETNDCCWD
jgi:hypothetical protein